MIQKPDDVIVGWDSAAVRDNEIQELVIDKAFVKAGVVIAVAGSVRASDAIETADIPDYDGSDPRIWLIKVFRPAVVVAVKEEGLYDEERDRYDVGMLVAVGGQAFSFDSSLSPVQYKSGQYASGSGQDYALGVLAAGGMAIEALMTARRLDPYTGGDLTVKSARSMLEDAARPLEVETPFADRYAVEEYWQPPISIPPAYRHNRYPLVGDFPGMGPYVGDFLQTYTTDSTNTFIMNVPCQCTACEVRDAQ